ncbi:hypothetical protein D1P53_006226 [Cryptococcus gattii VGV]|nr:hypothetical protein D1P53_006226 [Cryptococcus gattii VGV]
MLLSPVGTIPPPVLLHITDPGIAYDPITIITALGNLGHQPDHPYFTNIRTESNIDTFAPTEGRLTGCYGLILSATPNWADGRPRLEPHPFEAHGRKIAYGLATANESARKVSEALVRKKGLGIPEVKTDRKARKRPNKGRN